MRYQSLRGASRPKSVVYTHTRPTLWLMIVFGTGQSETCIMDMLKFVFGERGFKHQHSDRAGLEAGALMAAPGVVQSDSKLAIYTWDIGGGGGGLVQRR